MPARFALALILAACPLAAAGGPPFFEEGKLRVLILSGRNNHDWRSTTPALARILEQTGRFDVRVTQEPAGLNTSALAPYHVLVSDYNGPRWGPVAEKAVEEFVRSGRGFVSTHAASYAFGEMEILGDRHVRTGLREPPWPAYAELTGARWSASAPKSGHGKRHLFRVQWTGRAHPATAGAGDGFLISDELYHNLRMLPGANVLATAFDSPAMDGTGKDEPIAWTTAFGTGRAFHTTLGHDTSALSSPGFAALFARAVLWAAGDAVTPPGAASSSTPSSSNNDGRPVRVTLVTGGHDYEPSLYGAFDHPALRVRVNPHPVAYRGDLRKSTDVLVLYDMVQETPEDQRRNLTAFLEAGKGMVVLHHALADYNGWEWWWRDVVGGRYLLQPDGGQPASTFQHDLAIEANPAPGHPLARGLAPMLIHDEAYHGMWISPRVTVLLETKHPASDGPLAWVSPYEKSRVVVIQLGHGPEAHRHPGFQQLVRKAILWAAGRP
ncbi:MAG: ThuA domain-containing protein [Bryobacterales bacterium]|nr:ThuA domain-containing protein [Bryobacterales bacterium]